MKHSLGKQETTERGFKIVRFKDHYGSQCSLQQSSIWLEDNEPGCSCVWLGVSVIEPKVMASDASSVGIKTEATVGWVDYPLPEQVTLNNRMHLDRDQVLALVKHLNQWLENGNFVT